MKTEEEDSTGLFRAMAVVLTVWLCFCISIFVTWGTWRLGYSRAALPLGSLILVLLLHGAWRLSYGRV